MAFAMLTSFPAVLPSFSLVCVTSRMSSMTWKARPRARPKRVSDSSCVGGGVRRSLRRDARRGEKRGGLCLRGSGATRAR